MCELPVVVFLAWWLLFDVLTLSSSSAALPLQASTSDSWTKAATAFTSTEPGSAEVSGPQAPSVCSQPRAVAAATQALPGATVSLAHRWSPVLLSGVWEGERGDGQGVPILAPWRLAVLTVQGPTCTGDHRLWPGDMSCPRSRSVGLRY